MKKIVVTTATILVVAGMVLLLIGNKKKSREQADSVSLASGTTMVSTVSVTSEDMDRSFSANGVAQAVNELNFVSEITGRVVKVFVDKGSRVVKGTPLLKIDSELLEADYNATLASYEALCKDEKRFTLSYEAGGVSSQQLDNIRTQLAAAQSRLTVSKWKLDNAVVKAPIAGTINMRYVEPGALIAPNAPLFEIVDDSRIKVTCNLPESRIGLVHAGDKVVASSSESESLQFSGTVRSVGIKTDRGLNYPVEIYLDKTADLHAGMYLKVRFQPQDNRKGILIPRKAVVGSVLSANVYVASDGKAHRKEVVLGEMTGDRIEIVEGLSEGDQVIVSGLMNIADGSAITVINQ